MSEHTGVYKAIAKVTGAMSKEGISKGRKNQQQGYSFRGIDDVYNVLSGMLADAGLCIIPRIISRIVQERQTKSGSSLFYVTVEAEYDLVSAEDGSKHTARTFGEAMDSADKATNKAMSAAYKYMAFQTFAIPTEGDNDADAHTPVVSARNHNPSPEKKAENVAKAKAALAKPAAPGSITGDPSEGDLTVLDKPDPERIKKMLERFTALDMDEATVGKEFGKPVAEWTNADMTEAVEWYKVRKQDFELRKMEIDSTKSVEVI